MKVQWILGLLVLQFSGFGTVDVNAQEFRLPSSIVPTHYHLRLQPILDETPGHTRFTAPGSVNITVTCTEATKVVKLHALDLTINEDSTGVVDVTTGQQLHILNVQLQPENHFFVINLNESLRGGNQYEIFISFVTPVSQTRLDGMYLDSYIDPATNERRYVATTLFAAISARRCYPSFDEPQFKAVFTIELVRKTGYHSLSNRHQIGTEPLEGMNGWYIDKFAPSLRMSTYLVAMIVSDMTFEEAILPSTGLRNDDTTIRVYAPYYLINRGGGIYAANHTKNVLMSFENYFNNIFMLTKLDSVSLPRFFFSAMENWSLITYNDKVLLYFPGETTEAERYRITSIVAHEVVHHYFGNLVTCEWWTWIWLNEGGATYFSHLGVEMTYPEFNPWERFVSEVFQVALDFDSTPKTHPVANEPKSLADIGGIYDDISYEKGASLLRMIQSFLSEEVMQAAIRKYLKEREFVNARQDDLFEILQNTAEEMGKGQIASVKEIMDTWTLVSGYPLLRVSRFNSTSIVITQEKFQIERKNKAGEDMWWIPISIKVISPTPKEYFLWMSNKENQTTLSIPETETFVVNPKSEGYYRTMYSSELLHNILHNSVQSCVMNRVNGVSELSSTAKSNLIDDYVAFKKAGLIELDIGVILKHFCLKHENLLVWETVMKYYTQELLNVHQTGEFDTATQIKLTMKKHVLPLINEALEEMSVVQEKGEKVMLHAQLTFWTCLIDVDQPHCKHYVEEKMRDWTSSKTAVSPFQVDLEETYFCIAASLSQSYWEKIYKYMEQRNLAAAKARIANALMCTTNVLSLQRVLSYLENDLQTSVGDYYKTLKLPITAEKMPFLRTSLRLLFNEPARKFVFSRSYFNHTS